MTFSAAKPNEPPMQMLRKWIAGLDKAIARDDFVTSRRSLRTPFRSLDA
jgi:O-antigen biosynthesis protein WbqV